MNYNPYMGNMFATLKSPQQMQEEYNNLMSQYSNMYNQNAPQSNQNNVNKNQNPAVTEKGQYIKVASFEEVQNYPTSLDGTASLFFDFSNKVFWSKKFINGSHAIQAFKFEPINNTEPLAKQADSEIDYTKDLADIPNSNDERLEKLEKMMEKLLNKKSNAGRPPKQSKEEVVNEI